MGRLHLLVLCLFLSYLATAQSPLSQNQSNDDFHLGLELFEKGHLVSARQSFEYYIEASEEGLKKIDAKYYAAICATRLFNEDGEKGPTAQNVMPA